VYIYNYVDSKSGLAMKMYGKRCTGYRSVGYKIIKDNKMWYSANKWVECHILFFESEKIT